MGQLFRIRLSVALPFVLGIFLGTLITSFLMLALRSIDEEMPVEGIIKDKLSEVQTVEEFQEQYAPVRTQIVTNSHLVSYNVLIEEGMLREHAYGSYQTWANEEAVQDKVDYFVFPYAGDKEDVDFALSKKMPVISLEDETAPVRTGTSGVFKLWERVCHQKREQYLWFAKIRDDVYLRRRELEDLLSSMNSSEPLLVGKAVHPSGKEREDLGLRKGENYCHEASYVLSWMALELLCPRLKSCQENTRSFNEDVEIARCLRLHAGINCTTSTEMKELFYSADDPLEQEEMQMGEHRYNNRLHRAITLTPLAKVEHFYHLHQYYSRVTLEALSAESAKLRTHMIQTAELGAQLDSILHTSEHQSPAWTKLGINLPYKSVDTEQDNLIHFQVSDNSLTYTESKHSPSRPVRATERKDTDMVLKTLMESQVAHGHMSNGSTLTMEAVLKRDDPQRGTDYFFQVVEKKKSTDSFQRTKFLHCLRELLPLQVTSLTTADYKSTKVNFVVSAPSVSRGFQRFMMSFENSFLSRKQPDPVGLLVLMYSDVKFKSDEKDLFAVSTLVTLYQKKYPNADLRLIPIRNKYSRRDMLEIASKEYSSYELLFLSDIHVDFSTQFVERCRMNAIEDKQVYFPAVFNPYKPSEFYKEKILYPYATKFQIGEKRGSWMQGSYHIACIYNYDLMKALENKEGVGRDWSLIDSFIRQKDLWIFRSAEPGLVHLWQDGCKEVESESKEGELCHKLQRD